LVKPLTQNNKQDTTPPDCPFQQKHAPMLLTRSLAREQWQPFVASDLFVNN
jgi:hypothetical protein